MLWDLGSLHAAKSLLEDVQECEFALACQVAISNVGVFVLCRMAHKRVRRFLLTSLQKWEQQKLKKLVILLNHLFCMYCFLLPSCLR